MIQITDLSFSYDRQSVLSHVSMSFGNHGLYGVLGPNGSGKSTLMKLISGIIKAQKKTIYIDGQELNSIPRRGLAKKIAYVPQQFHVDYGFTIEEVLKMGRYPYHGRFDSINQEEMNLVNHALEVTGLTHMSSQSITELSGGELQRVMIARALVQDTPIIILDEPVSHLDIHYQKEIIQLLKDISVKSNKLIITVLHDMNIGLNHCDQIHLLHSGGVTSGLPVEVLSVERIESVYHTKVHMVADANRQLISW